MTKENDFMVTCVVESNNKDYTRTLRCDQLLEFFRVFVKKREPLAVKMKKEFLDRYIASGGIREANGDLLGIFYGLPVILDESIEKDYELVFKEEKAVKGAIRWDVKS